MTEQFSVDVDQNRYLAAESTRVDAVVSVTASGAPDAVPAAPAEALEIIVIDASGSMQGDKIVSARTATMAAIEALRDGVRFAVVVGDAGAHLVYPPSGSAVPADTNSRAAAARAVKAIRAGGGTRFGNWLELARQIAEQHPDAIRHVLLLTDGQNGESPDVLADRVRQCTGVFTCDCRGVGTDWRPDELRLIAGELLGTVDIVARPEDLAADFGAIMNAAMDKRMADVVLRLTTPVGVQVRFVKQVAPAMQDLTDRRTEPGDYPLGSWGSESRDYHVCLEVPARGVGEQMRAAKVSVLREGEDGELGKGSVLAEWTDDEGRSTAISKRVAHYTGQAELAEAIQDGLAARKAGDERTATARLGRAVALADSSGHVDTARLLERVVEVVDAPSGTVRLRASVDEADEMTLDIRSVRTSRVRGEG